MLKPSKKTLNFLIIIFLSFITFMWTFFIFHKPVDYTVIFGVIAVRIVASRFILNDYSLSWSKASQKSFLIKSFVYVAAFFIYMPFFYTKVRISFLASELFFYIFALNFLMYAYYYYRNRSHTQKTKNIVIFGAGHSGTKLQSEFTHSEYRVKYFVDDDPLMQNRSIDAIEVLSTQKLKEKIGQKQYDLLVVAMPVVKNRRLKEIYEELSPYFKEIKVLPPMDEILRDKDYTKQLKDISLEDLLARNPQDLDKDKIEEFIQDKKVLITGAGGSIGSEIARQCAKYGAKELILLDHSEYNLYSIVEELRDIDVNVVALMQSVVNLEQLQNSFANYKPEIVIHAAAYKHVPLVELNVKEAIINNIVGTKNVIESSIEFAVEKLVVISTDKAVRPTNVMGATKRVCELYAQNISSKESKTEIVTVRFGNVLGSSGSVIPKFKKQIEMGGPITVTHPDITRYFMLIPEACELVLQAASIGEGGEIFILDMGEPVKIVDLAKRMIHLSGRDEIEIKFIGLRPGEKLYEELLIDESDANTEYKSITIARATSYNIDKLKGDIDALLQSQEPIKKLQEIIPEFNHQKNI